MDQQTKDLIKDEIDNNEVCLFMKGTPDAPQCGFSMAVSNILKILEVNFKGVNVLENQNLREGIKVFSDWPTIPQLYVKNEFIGGCDIVKEMYESGELAKLFESKNINFEFNDFTTLSEKPYFRSIVKKYLSYQIRNNKKISIFLFIVFILFIFNFLI